MSQVDKLKGRGKQAIAIDHIKCAALSCRYPLEEFLAEVQKYEKNLGLGLGKSNDKIKNAFRKVQFAFGPRKEANNLRIILNTYIGTINMLLVQQGLETLDVASECMDKNQEELRVRVEESTRELREVKGNSEAQAVAVKENNAMIRKLVSMVSGDLAAPLKALAQMVTNVW